MSDGQDTTGGVAWERAEAWKMIEAATAAGDTAALALAWSRYSDAMANGALSAAGAVLIPLDRKIEGLTRLFENARNSDLTWRTEERLLRDTQADRLYAELNSLASAIGELARGVGGLKEQVADHEVRIVALETHGAPAAAIDELHVLRSDVEHIRALLILTRRQLWFTFAAVAAIATVFMVAILIGGGK